MVDHDLTGTCDDGQFERAGIDEGASGGEGRADEKPAIDAERDIGTDGAAARVEEHAPWTRPDPQDVEARDVDLLARQR